MSGWCELRTSVSAAQSSRSGDGPCLPSCAVPLRARCVQRGYELNERVVRAAEVGVSRVPDEQEGGEQDDTGGGP